MNCNALAHKLFSFQTRLILQGRNVATCRLNRREKEIGDDGLPKDYKLKTLRTGSRRLDTFVNRATGNSGGEVTKMILQGKVRVNDEVYTKKAYNVCTDDIIEVWKKSHPDNSDLALVERTEIVGYEVTENGYNIEVKSWKNFISDNWRSSSKDRCLMEEQKIRGGEKVLFRQPHGH